MNEVRRRDCLLTSEWYCHSTIYGRMEWVWLRDSVVTMHNHLAIECFQTSSVYPLTELLSYNLEVYCDPCICMQFSCICAQSIMNSYLYHRSQLSRTLLRLLNHRSTLKTVALSPSLNLSHHTFPTLIEWLISAYSPKDNFLNVPVLAAMAHTSKGDPSAP